MNRERNVDADIGRALTEAACALRRAREELDATCRATPEVCAKSREIARAPNAGPCAGVEPVASSRAMRR